jgi:hypothetical protein
MENLALVGRAYSRAVFMTTLMVIHIRHSTFAIPNSDEG